MPENDRGDALPPSRTFTPTLVARGRANALARHHGPDHPAVVTARSELAAAVLLQQFESHARRLTTDTRIRLALALACNDFTVAVADDSRTASR